MGISVAIMAHPRREAFVAELAPKLPKRTTIVWDERNDEWDTGRRSLLAYDPKATHHLLVQDDAIVPPKLVEALRSAVEFAGDRPIGLYQGETNTGPSAWRRARAIEEARKRGSPWIACGGPWWGVAFVVATHLIDELVEWCDANRDFAAFDRRIARHFEILGLDCLYTVPSLVDHRPVGENPSLYSDRRSNRRAFDYVGRSPVGLDFSRDPVAVFTAEEERARQNTMRRSRMAVVRPDQVIADRDVAVTPIGGQRVQLRIGKPVQRHLIDAYREAVADPKPKASKAKPKARRKSDSGGKS